MPVQGTMGGASARGMGLFGGPPRPAFPAGTFGIVTLGANATATQQYTFSSDTAAAYSALLIANSSTQARAAVADAYQGIFSVGALNATTTNRMVWATGSVVAGAITPTTGAYNCGMSNSTVGLIVRGINGSGTPTDGTFIYNFGANTCVVGSNLGIVSQFGGGCGTATFGMINVGGSASNAVLAKYTYANGAVVGGTNLVVPCWHAPAFGNDTVGIFGNGNTTTNLTTQKYTWAADTVAVSGNLSKPCFNASAMSTAAFGYTASQGTPNTGTNKYAFASDVCAFGGSFGGGISSGTMAVPNGQVGVSA